MNKLDAILSGRNLTTTLTDLKKRQINRVMEATKDNVEKQKEDASIEYEKLLLSLGDDHVDYSSVIKRMLENQQIIISANDTLKAIEAINTDLAKEV